jgi:TonB-dependent receptor
MIKKAKPDLTSRGLLLGTCCLAGIAATFAVPVAAQEQQEQKADADATTIDEVVVTGFRGTLQNSAADKRANISFTDAIFAEDIGKFPDINLAESLQRIPGVQIQRDVTGEGTSVAIRGLGRDFTQITLNGSRIETASDSNIDNVSQGRGLDLVLFPGELFRQITVAKTPTASQVEGAIAANVDLRLARPFDNKGFHINYAAKANYQESSEELSPRLGVYASNTWDTGAGEFGVLGGIAYSDRKFRSDGFNTIGWTTVSLGNRCSFATDPLCNSFANPNNATGYGNTSQQWPTTVPLGYSFGANGANPGDPLTVCGAGDTPGGTSGLSCRDLSFAIWPRLARPDALVGNRESKSAVMSLQWASPSDSMSAYLEGIWSDQDMPYERNDLNLAIRSINTNVPMNVVLDENNVVTSARIANPIWLNENRPYHEIQDFINLNGGFEWQIAEKWKIDTALAYNHSNWFRSTNTYLFNSNLNTGITVDLETNGDGVVRISPSEDLNNVNFWNWNALRIQPVERDVYQKTGHLSLTWGDERFNVKLGADRDKFHREVTSWDVTSCATDALGGLAPVNECAAALAADGEQNAKVAVPNASLGDYMQPWTHGPLYNTSDFDVGLNNGWALPNYRMLDDAVNIDYFENVLGRQLRAGIYVAGYTPRILDEQTTALYLEVNGALEAWHNLKYNVGVRRIDTDQQVAGMITTNVPTAGVREMLYANSSYSKYLPSFNLASEVTDGLVLRLAGSRTMTRAQPGDIAPNESLSVSGDVLTRGNPELAPYFSDNLDVGAEWYFGDSGLGVFAANAWAKRVEGYTLIRINTVAFSTRGIDYTTLPLATQTALTTAGQGNPNNAPVRVDQRQNTDEIIHLYGLELTYTQPLDFLLKGSGLTFNYTRIDQYSTDGPAGAPSSAITGLSPYTYNVTAFYENAGFSGRLSYAFRDAYVSFLGNNENNIAGDNWARPSGYLDASVSYKLPVAMDISISVEAQNITNEQQLVYFRNDPNTPRASFAPGRQILLGISGSF